MKNSFAYDVFISHNSADKPRVRQLAERLRDTGLKVWFDEWIIQSGDDIYLAIEHGLETSKTLILCMSPAAFGSDWVSLERSTALFRDPSNQDRRFLPLLLADCELPDTLRRYKYIDWRNSKQTAFDELLAAFRTQPRISAVMALSQTNTSWNNIVSSKETHKTLAVLEQTLTGHQGWVNSIAVSPDGAWFASGSVDRTIKIWDAKTGDFQNTLIGHSDGVVCIAISKDGKSIVSGAIDNTIRFWDARNGDCLHIWRITQNKNSSYSYEEPVMDIAILQREQAILTCGNGSAVSFWNQNSTNSLDILFGHTEKISSIAVSRDEKHMVSGSYDRTIRFWDLVSRQCIGVLKGHQDIVNFVELTNDGAYAISGSNDKTIKIWDLNNLICIGTLEGLHSNVQSVAISPTGSRLVVELDIGTLILWDWKSDECITTFSTSYLSLCLTFNSDGDHLLIGLASPECSIEAYSLVQGTLQPLARIEYNTRRYTNAKVVLVGESGVGKSGLAHRLINDKFVPTHSTHGMQVWRIDLPGETQDNLEREALLWDLAGQEDYRLIHQLFLDETALALVLINPQKDDPFAEVVNWVKVLDNAVANNTGNNKVVRLLIAARIDVGSLKVGQSKIDRLLKDYGFSDYLETSAKRGDHCSDRQNQAQASALKQLIAKHISWESLPWTSTPLLLSEIKNAILDMTELDEVRLLRFDELYQRLNGSLGDQTINRADVNTAITLLSNHGLVMPLQFGDLVLLRPELLNSYASAIIRAARAHTDEIGCVAENDVFSDNFDWDGVERLNRADELLLLRSIIKTFLQKSLCIAEQIEPEPDSRLLIFPSQYRRERAIPNHPEIFVSYSFAGETQTIYTTLVVRLWYSQHFNNKEMWRNAAELTTKDQQTLGFVMDRKEEGKATLSIFFASDVAESDQAVLIEFVHQHLQRHALDVQRDRHYGCSNCGEPVRDLLAVRKRLAAGKEDIICQICDQPVQLIDQLEQRLVSDPIARKVLEMDQIAGRTLSNQAQEQILIGHMMAICGEANQIFRPVSMFDYGIDGEVEFLANDGKPSGKKIYVQLKSGTSYLRERKRDDSEIFDVKNQRHLDYWISLPVDVYLVIRDAEETIRWMNITQYLKQRPDKTSHQIVFEGEQLNAPAVWRLRDHYVPAGCS